MKIEKYYLEHFNTNQKPEGVDVFEKDYDYTEIIDFAESYAKALLEEAAEKIDRSQIGELDQWDEGYNKGIERAVKILSSLQIKQQ